MTKMLKVWRIGVWFKGTLDTMWSESFMSQTEITCIEDVLKKFKEEYDLLLEENANEELLAFVQNLYYNLLHRPHWFHVSWKPVFLERIL